MALKYLDHVNVRTGRLAEMIRFYSEVLGMRVGPRPNFPFGGAWMYCGERPVVHLVETSEPLAPGNALQLEHFAFAADAIDELLQQLKTAGVPFRVKEVETRAQVHFSDPDGNHIHVDFTRSA
jgi:catechol 2,3-dioxygenase-like lactoylglutathione lyase family enzyme